MEEESTTLEIAQIIDAIKNEPPRYERDGFKEGLFTGFVKFHLTKDQNEVFTTIGRSACDACLLVIRHPDGSSDGVLAHLFANPYVRQAYAEMFDELDIFYSPDDTSEAIILTTTGLGSEDDDLQKLIEAVTKKNNNLPPKVLKTDIRTAFNDGSEIEFRQIAKKDGHIQKVKIANPKYRSEFRHRSPIERKTRRLLPPRAVYR